jgi:LysR family transcriptional regulator, glycine cleavage system transcriptional activator
MARLPLHTLPTFRVVARLQNLRAAADELHLTHSAVSQQIKLLEAQCGVQLFERVGRRVQLNDAGRTLQAAVEGALDQLDNGLRAAAALAAHEGLRLRLTLTPSFAQRWLLPRMAGWRRLHPDISLELHATPQWVDLQREGCHVALRQGLGPWRGLKAERLIDSPLVAVASPGTAERLRGQPLQALVDEPLLGDADSWQRWFALDGVRAAVRPVASFNDAGHLLQATEMGIGIALTRELLAADALRDGRLVRLSPLALPDDEAPAYWLVYAPELAGWAPLAALRTWLRRELRQSARSLSTHADTADPLMLTRPARTTAARR